MKKTEFDFSKFENLAESNQGQLIGGFSMTLQFTAPEQDAPGEGTTNNCNSGNCVQGCSITNKLICL